MGEIEFNKRIGDILFDGYYEGGAGGNPKARKSSKGSKPKDYDYAAKYFDYLLGKIKTCTQIACIIVCIVEPILYSLIPGCEKVAAILPASIATTALMTIFTLLSGINYLRSYWKYLDPEK